MTRTHTFENPHRVVLEAQSGRRIEAAGHGRVLQKQRDKVLGLPDSSRQRTETNETPVPIYSSNGKTKTFAFLLNVLHCTHFGLWTQRRRCFVMGNTVPQDLLATRRNTLKKISVSV